ncbi:XRE family transcriptional regulator [Actinomadura rupiterrae]|uniref:XRE family transcriptional regulator n=1 Tax=Actinomadura rupiterrae TaxID=559627 RepID=UPI0020A2730D|nr:XRE family transcriptional regulator [Actinomadura rupiterrae]MCP2337907.1 transcriptional regulator with XRE-family HTH domain [Actinomadura rupiterrae]
MSLGLKQAREARGWSQSDLLGRIERYVEKHPHVVIANSASLKTYISSWENGRRRISEPYRTILRALLGWTDEELLDGGEPLADADGYAELIRHIDTAHAVSRSMVATFVSQTELLRTQDRMVGAFSVVDQMNAHLSTLEEALTFAVLPDARRPVARELAGAATLAAWQALDVGAIERAWRHYEKGKQAAKEAEDRLYLAHAMGEQAFVLADAGRPGLAVDLVVEAQRIGGAKMSERLRAWLAAAEAELRALTADAAGAREALDRATKAMPGTEEPRDPDLASVFLNTVHFERWRGHTLALLGDEEAVAAQYAVLDSLDPTFVRARAGLHCDLAQAHLVRGEYAEAAQQVREAKLLANRTGSIRYRRRIAQLGETIR